MPVISFAQELLDDAKLLPTLNPEFLQEFCKISLDHIKNGVVNKKIYAKAADQLKTNAAAVSAAITALCHILLESTRRDLNASDFQQSTADLKFSEAQFKVVSECYFSNVKDMRRYLWAQSLPMTRYVDLDWRLDIQLASRSIRQQAAPTFVLKLKTSSSANNSEVEYLQSDFATLKHLCTELEKAVNQAKSVHARRILRYVK